MKSIVLNKKQLGTGILVAIWFLVLLTVFAMTLMQKAEASERQVPIYSVCREDKAVAVTFDVAWGDETTQAVLKVLAENDVKATFFVVGTFAEQYPESVKRIAAAGHEIGNHSYNHKNPTKLNPKELTEDIRRCNTLLTQITGQTVTLYRFPSGAYNNSGIETVKSAGMTPIQWNVDSIDWKDITATEITRRIQKRTTSGSILLFHLGKENTLEALPAILGWLKQEGYRTLTVSELLLQGKTYVDNNGRQRAESRTQSSSANFSIVERMIS